MIIGTAGHIDHGKTALIRALTGVAGDRLKDEQARGITIDLGYAYAPMGNGDILGFVDVPGHEKLVHNMLAGATGIDFVLLVIAADDGPMPQTREHLAILDLLGLRRGAVALTKTDRVGADRLKAALGETVALLAPTGLAGSPVFPLSAGSGEGVAALRHHLEQAALACAAPRAGGYFRLAVDRAFTLAGAGTVVTGTVVAGTARIGDRLLVSPAGAEVRVRSIHAQNRPAEAARAGQRCALNLAGAQFGKDDVHRGDWLVEAPIHLPLQRFDAHCRVLASEARPLKHWTPVHLHTGARDITARLAVLEGEAIAPGASALVQIVTDKPVCVLHGDRFILRDQAATRTVGGGTVLDPFPPSRNRRAPARLAALHAMREPDAGAALRAALQDAAMGVDLAQYAKSRNIREEDAQALWQGLPMRVAAAGDGALGFAPAHWHALQQTVLERLAAEHAQAPDALGPERARLHRMALPALQRRAFDALLDELLTGGGVAQSGPWLHLPGHRVQLTQAEDRLWQRIRPLLLQAPFQPPRVRDIGRELAVAEGEVRALLRRTARTGEVYLVAQDHYFARDAVKQLAAIAASLARAEGSVRAAAFRDRTGVGRKLAIQILEFFDRIGYTRRTGDQHRLRQENLLS